MPRDNNEGRIEKQRNLQSSNQEMSSKERKQNTGTHSLDNLEKESEKNRNRKPGSQADSSDQKNNGRGGGK